ncbi:hypothetical protein Cni_G08553 [Canna indica]|uniref:SAM domain-containing protein n=1 Tax=Canna indica TaxID=4628 RepID=A0AAQ3K0N4_9LILI|nr:hypothetical protein Cni_G08553 [Canna indica]
MDWYSWLSKSHLDPSLACEYAVLFANNELEEEDVAYFDHGFLQSMGIAIAKHRLEILKLAKQASRSTLASPPLPVAKLVAVIRKSKNCLAKYIRGLARGSATAPAILVLPKSEPWRGGATMRRKTKLALLKQGRLMITDGGVRVAQLPPPPPRSHSASPMIGSWHDKANGGGEDDHEVDDEYWETAVDAMKWDAMFQNLKPT